MKKNIQLGASSAAGLLKVLGKRCMCLLFIALLTIIGYSASYAQSPLCSSGPTDFGYEYISSVTINGATVAGATGFSGPGYFDYTGSSMTTLVAGNTYNISVTVQTNDVYQEYVKMWIDFNGNNDLQDAGELVFDQNYTFNGTQVYSGTVTIPSTAYNGAVYIRTILVYSSSPTLCGSYDYGATVDCKATITGGVTPHKLTIATSGTGSVSSSPAGINTASSINSADFAQGSNVTLTATPSGGASFAGWTGSVTSTTNPLTVTMDADKNITATFATAPVLTTTAASSIAATTATSGGNITSDGGSVVTARGVCWNTGGSPTISNSKTSDGTGTGSFVSSLTGLLPGTTYHIRAYATNGVSTSYGNELTFTTSAAPSISLAPGSLTSATVASAYSATISATGGTAPYSYSITAGSLPAGLSLSSGGVLSGTPTAGGNYNFTVTATDAILNTGSQAYTLTVQPPTITLSPATLSAASVGSSYSTSISASGGTAPYTFSITSGSLPGGLTLSSGGTLSGTPLAAGTFNFTVTATDATTGTGPYTGSQAYSLTVNAPTITVSPSSLTSAIVGSSYSASVNASGGSSPYTFNIISGSLPAGLSLSSGGVLSGTPSAGGSFNFTVQATDADSFTGSQAYTLTVNAPTITVSPSVLASGTATVPYGSTIISASGGTGPYTYAVTNGSMPSGMSLSSGGTLSGTPSAGGTFNFTVTATDVSTGTGPYTGSVSYSLFIDLPTPTITFNALANKTYGDADFDAGATSDNTGTAVTYTSSNTAVATIVSGKVHIMGAGTTTITASQAADANYKAATDVPQSLTVDKASLTVTADAQNKNYGDADPALTYQISSGSLVGSDAFSGALTRDAGENVGAYAIHQGTLALSSNYNLSFTGANLTIGTRAITVTADAQNKNYGDADPSLTYQITSGSLVGSDAFSGALTRDAGENVGAYAIHQGTLALSSNYNLSFTSANLTIGTRAITVTADAQNKNYGDADPSLTYQITSGSLVGSDAFSGALTRDAGENVGAYAIHQGTLALSSNYSLSFTSANLSIGTRAITVAANAQNKNYGDADPSLTYQITSGSLVGSDAFSGALTRDAGENVGAYAIHQGTLALSSNYNLSFTGANLTIGTRAITVTADAQNKNYGDADPALTYQITSGSLVGSDAFSGALSRDAGENVGAYAIHQGTLALSSNYNLSFTGANLTIGTRAITVTADAQNKNYGDADPALTYQITSGSLVGSDAFSGALTRDAGENVGAYAIHQGTLALSGNYSLSFTGANLTIGTRAITVTADAQNKNYGDADPALTYQITSGSLVGSDAFSGALTRDAGENVGAYAIHQGTLALSNNYSLAFTGANLSINKAALSITANSSSRTYGQANPVLSVSYTGFVNGDDASKLTTQPSVATTATVNSATGTYPITASGAASLNYTISYVTGTLTITNATLTITADNQTKVYGSANPALSVRYSGFVGSDDASKFTTVPTVSTTASATSAAGDYTITASAAIIPNYTLIYQSGVLTITKAPLTVTAEDQIRAFGAANPGLTVSYSGFVNGDDASKLTTEATASTVANVNTPPGTYPITVTGAASSNYTFTYVPGTLTIIPLTDASLSGLVVNPGSVAISPDFSPGVYDYSAKVGNEVDRVNVTALFASTATAQINGSVLYNNSPSADIFLHTGDNSISITITAQDGSQHTYTISIYRGLPASSITATNILTPNGDGKNDTWLIKDINLYPDNTVSVYDRAGRLVYNKHGYQNDWDGTLKGSPLEQGTYYFTISLGNGGNLIKGFITIIRE